MREHEGDEGQRRPRLAPHPLTRYVSSCGKHLCVSHVHPPVLQADCCCMRVPMCVSMHVRERKPSRSPACAPLLQIQSCIGLPMLMYATSLSPPCCMCGCAPWLCASLCTYGMCPIMCCNLPCIFLVAECVPSLATSRRMLGVVSIMLWQMLVCAFVAPWVCYLVLQLLFLQQMVPVRDIVFCCLLSPAPAAVVWLISHIMLQFCTAASSGVL